MLSTILPIITLLVVVTLSLLITRIATMALRLTGISKDLARFQARSAFTGVGFTTVESEHILEHPVRRKIIMLLMVLGNAGFVTAVSSLMFVFVGASNDTSTLFNKIIWLLGGLLLLWIISVSKWVDTQMSLIIGWALKKWTLLEVKDYPALLHLSDGYNVSEMKVSANEWVTGKNLIELKLADEGVHVLGIRRADGEYLGAPTAKTYIRNGDTLLLYARASDLLDLEERSADIDGDKAHEQKVIEQKALLSEQEKRDSRDRILSTDDNDSSY